MNNDKFPRIPPTKQNKKPSVNHYGEKHKRLRLLRIKKYPICELCNDSFSEEAHHLRYGNDLTIADYRALCIKCHHIVHQNMKDSRK